MKFKLFRTATISISLNVLLKGQLQFLNRYYDVTALSGSDDFLLELKQREEIKIYDIEMQRHIAPIDDLKSLWKLYKYFAKEKPVIVHSITPKAGLLTMIAGKMAGVPIRMHTFTGLVFPTRTGVMQLVLIFMDKLLCYCATNIYPEGQGVKNDLIEYKITNKPLNIIANGNVNGIDTAYFSKGMVSIESQEILRTQLNISQENFIFIFVGRLVGDKGINELVDAFSGFNAGNVKLLLVGSEEKDLDPLHQTTCLEIESNSNIIAVGFQSDIRPYLAISNCLVFPSYREGFPNVVMQAGAMELPSIVSNINGCNEIIIDNINGQIIPVKNKQVLFSSMFEIVNNKELCSRLQNKSREMIVSRYEQTYVWNCILEEYKKLIKNV